MTPHASSQIITLNPASDAGALRAVRLACVTDTAGATSGAEWDALDPLSLHLAARTEDGQLIGSVRLTADRRLDRLGILPDWRRRGLADQLLAAAVDTARQHGWPSLHASPSPNAEAVFARQGFLPDTTLVPLPERIGQTHAAPGGVVHRRLDGPMAVETLTAALAATTGLLCAARRQVLIYTRALDPTLFDNAAVLDALRRFATARHDKRVHVLMQDPASANAGSSAMLRLAQRLPACSGSARSATQSMQVLHRSMLSETTPTIFVQQFIASMMAKPGCPAQRVAASWSANSRRYGSAAHCGTSHARSASDAAAPLARTRASNWSTPPVSSQTPP